MHKAGTFVRGTFALILSLALFATAMPIARADASPQIRVDQVLGDNPSCDSLVYRLIDLDRCAAAFVSDAGNAGSVADAPSQLAPLAAASQAIADEAENETNADDSTNTEPERADPNSSSEAACPSWSIADVTDDPDGDWDGDGFSNVFELYNNQGPCEVDVAQADAPAPVVVEQQATPVSPASETDAQGSAGPAPETEPQVEQAPVVFNPCPDYSIADVYSDVGGDWDRDGASNIDEVDALRDPCSADADADRTTTPANAVGPCPQYSFDDVLADGDTDWDGDGATNADEFYGTTDPCAYDENMEPAVVAAGGPCPDYSFEQVLADGDTDWDGDGATNADEFYGNTNPCARDEDVEGDSTPVGPCPDYSFDDVLADGDTDWDGDRVSNVDEFYGNSNPCLQDQVDPPTSTAGTNGCPDWEIQDLFAASSEDWDGDGIANLDELLQNNDPCVAGGVLDRPDLTGDDTAAVADAADPVDETTAVADAADPVDETAAVADAADPVDETAAVADAADPVDETAAVADAADPVDETAAVADADDPVDETAVEGDAVAAPEEGAASDAASDPVEAAEANEPTDDLPASPVATPAPAEATDSLWTVTGGVATARSSTDQSLQHSLAVVGGQLQLGSSDALDLAGINTIIIEGGSGDDTITLDASLASIAIPITVNGNGGYDTLAGPDQDTNWSVTGNGAGHVAGAAFTGIENLRGAANTEDTFVIEDGGYVSRVDGNDAGFDTMVVNETTISARYEVRGPDAGVVTLNTGVVEYVGLEPLIVTGAPNEFELQGTGAGETITAANFDAAGIKFDAPTMEEHDLTTPASQSITIDLAGGDDTFVITEDVLARIAAVGARLDVVGGAGSDTIQLDTDIAGTWDITGVNQGTWTEGISFSTAAVPAGLQGFSFSEVEKLVGAPTAADRIIYTPSSALSRGFDARGGNSSLSLGNYVHLSGSLSFSVGIQTNVTIATGLPSNGKQLLQEAVDNTLPGASDVQDYFNSLAGGAGLAQINTEWTELTGVDMATAAIGVSNASVFVGYNPNWSYDDATGTFGTPDPTGDPSAIGLYATGVDVGVVTMVPTNVPLGIYTPVFTALSADITQAGFTGFGAVEATLTNVEIKVNDGTEWAGIFGPPVVDFSQLNANAGYTIGTVTIEHDGNQRFAASAERVELKVGDFVHIAGSFAIEKGPVVPVDVATFLAIQEINILKAIRAGTTAAADLPGLGGLAALDAAVFVTDDPADGSFGVSTEFDYIYNVEVDTFSIAVDGVSFFAGYDPREWTDNNDDGAIDATDGDGIIQKGELSSSAVGLYGDNISFAMIMMSPTLNQVPGVNLPSFYAMRGSGDLGLLGGDLLTASLSGIELRVNGGDEWPLGLGPPVVDWEQSFPAIADDLLTVQDETKPIGFAIDNGTSTPTYIDFDGSPRVEVAVAKALLQVGDFVHVAGSFSFTTGIGTEVTVATGLPANLVDGIVGATDPLSMAFKDAIDAFLLQATGIDNDGYAALNNVEVSVFELGAADVDFFVGVDFDWVDANNDGRVTENEIGPNAVGLFGTNIDFGMVQMTPVLEIVPGIGDYVPKFYAFKATADIVAFVGGDFFEASLSGVTLEVNNGSEWPAGLGPPVVDFGASFEAVDDNPLTVEDETVLAGYAVKTGADPVYLTFDGNQRIGASVERAVLTFGDFVHIAGSFQFEMGPTTRVDIGTGFNTDVSIAINLLASQVDALVAVFDDASPIVDQLRAQLPNTPVIDAAITLLDELGLVESIADMFQPDRFATKAEAGGELAFSEDFSKLWNLEVGTFQIGGSNISAFVGYNPGWIDANDNGVIDDVNELRDDAIGLLGANIDFGVGVFDPTLGGLPGLDKVFPQMMAMKVSVGQAAFVSGRDNWFTVALGGVTIYQNRGNSWPAGVGSPKIDFVSSFPAVTVDDPLTPQNEIAPAGFPVMTGNVDEPVYLDFGAAGLLGFRAERVLLSIGSVVHITGSLSYEQGSSEVVTIATGLPANVLDLLNSGGPLGDLVDFAAATLNEVADRGGLDTAVDPDLGFISGLKVGVTRIGIGNASVFVGFNPGWGGGISESGGTLYFDDDTNQNGLIDESELHEDSIGLLVSGVNFGMVNMTPKLQSVVGLTWLPSFTAFKLTADVAKLVGVPEIEATLEGITVLMNNGGDWPGGLGPPVVNFEESFAAVDDDLSTPEDESKPVGYAVDTGATPVYLDFDGNQRIAVEVETVELKLSQFVYLFGSFAFEMGPTYRVDVATGLPSTLLADFASLPFVADLQTLFTVPSDPADGTFGLKDDFSYLYNVEVSSLLLGANNLSLFLGYVPGDLLDGDPIDLDVGADGVLTKQDIEDVGGVGFFASDVDFAFGMFTPTGVGIEALDKRFPKFYAVKATGAQLGLVGVPGIIMEADNIAININNGTSWPAGLGPPVIDFAASFQAEAPGVDDDGDGLLGEQAGFQVNTTGDPIYLDFDGNQRLGGGADRVTIQISEFVYLTGSIYFEMGPVQTVKLVNGPLLDVGVIADAEDFISDLLGITAPESISNIVALEKEVSFLTVGGTDLHAFVGYGGPYWSHELDALGNGDGLFDANEVNEDAVGVAITDLDFGLVMMTPTNPIDPIRYTALKATADEIALVGLSDIGVTATARGISFELNMSSPAIYGISIFPVVNFATTDFFEQGVGNGFRVRTSVTLAEPADCAITPEQLGCGVVITADSFLIKVAAENITIDLFGIATLWGSFALIIGPGADVTVRSLSGATNPHSVSMISLGFGSVSGFIGWDGPYWTDTNDNYEVDAGELNADATGFAITDADVGAVLAVDTTLGSDAGGWLGLDLTVKEFGLVGLDFLSITGTFGLIANVGFGLNGGISAIDWIESFGNGGTPNNPLDDGFLVDTGNPDDPIYLDSDGFLIHVFLAGELAIRPSPTADPIIAMLGVFQFTLSGDGMQVFADASAYIGSDLDQDYAADNFDPLFSLNVTAALVIDADGVAADLAVSFDFGIDALGFSGAVRVVLNTTGVDKSIAIEQAILDFLDESTNPLAGSLHDRLTSTEALNACTVAAAAGCFTISQDAPDLLNPTAVVGLLSGLSTTALPKACTRIATLNCGGVGYVAIALTGSFNFLNFATGTGTGGLVIADGLVQVVFDVEFDIGDAGIGLKFDASGQIEITPQGVLIDVQISLDADITTLFHLDASGSFFLDTRGAHNVFELRLSGRIDVAKVVSLSGTLNFSVGRLGADSWELSVTNLTGQLGPITLTANGVVRSDGQFGISMSATLQLGSNDFGVRGTVTACVSLSKEAGVISGLGKCDRPGTVADGDWHLRISFGGSAGVYAFGERILGITVNITGSATFNEETSLTLNLEACVTIIWEFCGDWDLFTITIPVTIFPQMPPNLARIDNGSTELKLNVGADAGFRNVGAGIIDENYRIIQFETPGQPPGQYTVIVQAFGESEVFSGVTKVTGDFGSGNDRLNVVNGAQFPVDVSGGIGNDVLVYDGSGIAKLRGGSDNDLLIGGSGNDELDGGSGADYLQGNGGTNDLDAGTGNDVIYGAVSDLVGDTVDGGGGIDTLEATGTLGADTFTVRAGATGIIFESGGTFEALGIEKVLINPLAGADTIVVDGSLASVGLQTITLKLNDGFVAGVQQNQVDNVTLRMSSAADEVILTGAQGDLIASNLKSGDGNITINPLTGVTVATTTAVWTGEFTFIISESGVDDLDLIKVEAGDEADDLLLRTSVANLALKGQGGSDRIAVGSNATAASNTGGTLEGIASPITVDGGAGSGDVLDIDDSGDGDGETGTLTATTLTGYGLHSTLGYQGVETLTLWLGNGADTVNIQSTSAAVNLTTVHAGGGNDIVNVSGAAPNMITGSLDGIAGALTIDGGSGSGDQANLSDFGDTTGDTGVLTSTTLSGFSPAVITYGLFEGLLIDLGSGGDNLVIQSVMTGPTVIDTNDGADIVTINGVAVGSNLTLNTDAAEDIVTVNNIAGTAVLNGTDDADRIIIDHLASTANVTINGLAGDDYITIRSTDAGSTLIINGGDGEDWIDIISIDGTVNVNGGDNDDTVEVGSQAETTARAVDVGGNVNGIQGALTIDGNNPQASDWLFIDETGETTGQIGAITSTTIDGLGLGVPITYLDIEHLIIAMGTGDDQLNVLSTNGPSNTPVSATETTLTLGAGADEVNVSSNAPTNTGTVNAVLGHLIINGDGDADTLNVSDRGDAVGNNGTLTATDLTGLGMGVTAGTAGITYGTFEFLNIDLGSGADNFLIVSTHAGQTTVDGLGGADTIDVRTIAGHTIIDGGAAADTVTVGSTAPTLGGTLNGINALLDIAGGSSADQLIVDDTGDSGTNVGVLTADTIQGLGTTIGTAFAGSPSDAVHTVTVANAFDGTFVLTVGAASTTALDFDSSADDVHDALVAALGAGDADIQVSRLLRGLELTWVISFVNGLGGLAGHDAGALSASGANLIGLVAYGVAGVSTASSTTGRIVYTEIETLDIGLGTSIDTLHVRSTHAELTRVAAGPGNDVLLVETIGGTTEIAGENGNDALVINPLPGIPDSNNGILGNQLTIDGNEGSDTYIVNVWNAETSALTITDSGVGVEGTDRLTVNGTSGDDTFLLRAGMIASLSAKVGEVFTAAEKIFYDDTIDAGVTLNALGGKDLVVFDDTSSLMTVNGGSGDDTFQIGQLFGGVIGDTLNVDTELTAVTFGQISNGVSFNATVNGGGGNDNFNVYHNLAVLQLNGDSGDDTFVVRTFLGIDEQTTIDAGDGRDLINYLDNAPVAINGGAGFDTIVVIGTEADDEFVITADGVFGAGRYVGFVAVEQLDVDGAEGDDIFTVLSTAPGVLVRIFGGLGSDTINVAADATAVYADDLRGHTGLLAHEVESSCATGADASCADGSWNETIVDGIAAEIQDNEAAVVLVSESGGTTVVTEAGSTDTYLIALSQAPTSDVRITVVAPSRSPENELFRSYSIEVSLDGTTWVDAATLVFGVGDWAVAKTVWVRAQGDLSSEGERIAAIQHLVDSDDMDFDGLSLNNVAVRIIDDERAGITVLEPDGATVVIEAGANDSYTVSLTRAPLTTATLTLGGDGQVCVATATDANADCGPITLVFDGTNWNVDQVITVSAFDDDLVESFHFGYVTTTISSGDIFSGTVTSALGKRITVTGSTEFTANDLRGYLLRITDGAGAGQAWDIWSNETSTGGAGNWSTVVTILGEVETVVGAGSTYFINGYTPPIVTDVLEGTVLDDGDLTDDVISVAGVVLPTLSGGLSGATIRIFLADGSTEFRSIVSNTGSTIVVDSDWVLSAGVEFSIIDVLGISVPLVAALIGDDDTTGVLITETDGDTTLAEGTSDTALGLSFDTYSVVLTSAPVTGETVTVTVNPVTSETLFGTVLRNDQQLCVASSLAGVVTNTDGSCGPITLTFTSGNWNVAQTVWVWAVDDAVTDGSELQDFADSAQRVYLIQGPLFVDGGIDEQADRSFSDPVLLPGETALPPTPPEDPAFDVIEDRQVDTLNVFNNDSVSPDVGNLTSTRLTGLGFGPDQFVGGRFLPGGISYDHLEALTIRLGRGGDQFTIESTHGGSTEITGNDGMDTFDIRSIAGHTNVQGDADNDTFRIGSSVPTLGGTVDAIGALLVIDGGSGVDQAIIDDSGDSDDSLGTLTQTSLVGLDMIGTSADSIYSVTIANGTTDVTFSISIPGRATVTLDLAVGFDATTLQAALQAALFPIAPITGCGAGGVDAVTPELDSVCSRSVFVWGHDGDFLIGFQGELQGIAVGLSVVPSGASPAGATATDLDRSNGINYYGLASDESLTILLGSGDDRFNVRGTLPSTRLDTAAGDDVVFVSDAADLGALAAAIAASDGSLTSVHDAALHGTVIYDDLVFDGSLDEIDGDLDIETGGGSNTLAVSDRADADADTNVIITDSTIIGMADGDITYNATGGDLAGQGAWTLLAGANNAGSGLFGRGITVHLGTGPDNVTIDSVLGGALETVPLQLVITTLYANDGADIVTINAPDVDEARLVIYGENGNDIIDAQAGALVAGLELIVFGNDGDDVVKGGANADILFGDDGRVFLFNDGAGFDVILGGDPVAIPDNVLPGGETLGQNQTNDLVFETVDAVFSLFEGGTTHNDEVRGGDGDDLIIGGAGNDGLDGEADRDIVVGDQAIFTRHIPGTTPLVRELAGTTIYDGVQATHLVDPRMGALAWTITLLDHAVTTSTDLWGNDVAAGGSEADHVFGQLGNDVLHGDGQLVTQVGGWSIDTNDDTTRDADDHVEGNGGSDHIRGGLGQDTIIGGSTNLFGLVDATMRPDTGDFIWGGNGDQVDRNELGATDHGRDADVILGDNGNVFRIVGTNGAFLTFNFDIAYGAERLVPRAVQLLDYSPTGDAGQYSLANLASPHAPQLVDGTNTNIGGGDLIHGEDGNDIVHGQGGRDTLFGDAHDDDLYGESGPDIIYGGTGDDGVIADDGTIHTSRNGLIEPLHGVDTAVTTETIRVPGPHHSAVVNTTGELNKAVDLEPFYVGSNDIVFGGWGNDFVHGGEGDDALTGAEALAFWYTDSIAALLASVFADPTNVLRFGLLDPEEFEFYDEDNPMALVMITPVSGGADVEFLLNNDATENATGGHGDGKDAVFGDGGNDWILGGTNQDHLYGGWGNDLLNADDDLSTNGGANDAPDAQTGPPSYADIAFGGAGRDVLIANTGADRLIDWTGEFNSYLVPFSPFGASTISRSLQPQIFEYLYDLAASDGADFTRGLVGDADRNGEPFGELGLITQQDDAFGDQHGAPDDPQPGNSKGKKDVRLTEPFTADATSGGTGSNIEATAMGSAGSPVVLTTEMLQLALGQAIASWSGEFDADVLAELYRTPLVITDLPGLILAEYVDGTIYLDSNAAGWGWYIDGNGSENVLMMNLVTVLAHEFGHGLGLGHAANGIMQRQLAPDTHHVWVDATTHIALASGTQVWVDTNLVTIDSVGNPELVATAQLPRLATESAWGNGRMQLSDMLVSVRGAADPRNGGSASSLLVLIVAAMALAASGFGHTRPRRWSLV